MKCLRGALVSLEASQNGFFMGVLGRDKFKTKIEDIAAVRAF